MWSKIAGFSVKKKGKKNEIVCNSKRNCIFFVGLVSTTCFNNRVSSLHNYARLLYATYIKIKIKGNFWLRADLIIVTTMTPPKKKRYK